TGRAAARRGDRAPARSRPWPFHVTRPRSRPPDGKHSGCLLERLDELVLRHLRAPGDLGFPRALFELGTRQRAEAAVRSMPRATLARLAAAARAVDARPECREQIGRLLLGDGCGRSDLLALLLRLDHLEQRLAVGVVVLLGLPRARERLDQLGRHVELALRDLGRLG